MFTTEEQKKVNETKAANRRKKLALIEASVDELVRDQTPGIALPEWARLHAGKARRGSATSLIALKCGDCCGWVRSEIRDCGILSCPLYAVRPYQEAARD